MIQKKYLDQLKTKVREFFPDNNGEIFIFGSSLRQNNFHDIDLGFISVTDTKKMDLFKESMEDSTFPYTIDIVDMQKTSSQFSQYVLSQEKKLWI